MLLYNILPGGQTILHKLYRKGELIEQIFKIAHSNSGEGKDKVKYHVPYVKNLFGQDLMLRLANNNDFRSMNSLLAHLSCYGIDHHSRAIIHQLPKIIEYDLPELKNYLNSRLQQTEQVSKINRGHLSKNKSHKIIAASLVMSNEEIDKLIHEGDHLVEQELQLDFYDLPYVSSFNQLVSQEFFDQLAKTTNMDLFLNIGIQMIIEFKWKLVQKYTIQKLFFPFIVF